MRELGRSQPAAAGRRTRDAPPGTAVILDTETTDLDRYVVEIPVVDAGTGQTLLDTLINPGCPIQPGALWVHGLSDADVWLRYVPHSDTQLSRSAKGFDLHVDSKLGVIVRQR